jgi:hypothetical protein
MRHPCARRLVSYACVVLLTYAIVNAPRSVQIGWFLFQGAMGVVLCILVYRDQRRDENEETW